MWKPVPKMTAAAIGGAVSVVVVWLIQAVGGVDVPAEPAAAFATLAAFAAGYIKQP